jgi:acyl carrier protein
MGLDFVELVLAVEDTYGLSIRDKDMEGLDTAGKLYDYIFANRFQGMQETCLSSVAFYRLRRALMSVLGVSREDVQLSASLATLIPTRRRHLWRELQTVLALRLPDLRRPVWVTSIATLAAVAPAIAIGSWLNSILIGVCVAFALGCALYRVTEPFAVEFRPEFVGPLVRQIVAKNFGAISDQCRLSNSEELWESLRTLIAEHLGVGRDEITRESHFVKDLGAD